MKEAIVLKLRQSFKGVQALLTLLIHQINVHFRDTPRKMDNEENGKMGKWDGEDLMKKANLGENGAFGKNLPRVWRNSVISQAKSLERGEFDKNGFSGLIRLVRIHQW